MTVELKSPPLGLPRNLEVGDDNKSGGEAAVFFSCDGKYAVKVFHDPNSPKEKVIRYVMDILDRVAPERQHYILPPLALIESIGGHRRVGYVMRRVPPTYKELIDYVLNPRTAYAQFEQGRTWEDFLRVARCICDSIVALHGLGCAHTDIHYRNFLASLDPPDAVMLEIDGVVVEGFTQAGVMGMLGFMAPEVVIEKKLPYERTDRYSLAVLLLHTLLFRNPMCPLVDYDEDPGRSEVLGYGQYALFSEHPSNDRHRPRSLGLPLYKQGALSYRMLPPSLQRLTDMALIHGLHVPDKRPSSRQWADGLAFAVDKLCSCVRAECRQVFPYPYWVPRGPERRCPFCGDPVDRKVAVLELFEPNRPCEYSSLNRSVVLRPGSRLYDDTATPGRKPPLTRGENAVIGEIEWDENAESLRIVNESDDSWTAQSLDSGFKRTAARGQSLPLSTGYCIELGAGKRLAQVIEQAMP